MSDFDFGDTPKIPSPIDVERIMLSASEPAEQKQDSEPASSTAPTPENGSPTDTPKKRGRPRKVDAQQAQVDAAMSNFFSVDGIGNLWVTGWQGFFKFCGAEPMPKEQEGFHAAVFASWAKHRMPETPEKYQPDVMLLASIAMMTLPRLQPIAVKTAPAWRVLGSTILTKVRGVFKRKKE